MLNKTNLIKTGIVGITIFSASLVLSGCSLTDQIGQKFGEKVIEKTIESQTGGAVNIDTENKELKINTNEGSVTLSGEGTAKLPANFPSDVFVYDDAKIIFSLSGSQGQEGYSISYTTNATVPAAASKYKQEMVGKGWKLESEVNLGAENGIVLDFKKGTNQVTLTIGTDNNSGEKGKTGISINGNKSGAIPGAEPIQE